MSAYINKTLQDLKSHPGDQTLVNQIEKTVTAFESVKSQQAFIAQRSVRLKGSVASRMGMSSKYRALNDAMTALDIPDRAKALSNIDAPEANTIKKAFDQQGSFFKKEQTSSYRLFKEKFNDLRTTIGKEDPKTGNDSTNNSHNNNGLS
ncbi:MAG: hypothetical protein K0U10_06090 [Gammaproteobacteria bacterium]|nr:hypothetical protein [Gammaproteobacteria bacterium]